MRGAGINMKLILGDARIELEKLQPNSVDVVITSPPYWNERGESRGNGLGVESDSIAYVRSLTTILNKILPLLKKGGSMWLIIGDDPRNKTRGLAGKVGSALVHGDWGSGHLLYWDKTAGTISKTQNTGKEDWIMQLGRAGETPNTVKGIEFASEFKIPLSKRFANSDTLAYPEQLVEALLMYSCKKNSTVLDPFVGTGTTVLVAERLGHIGIGIDLSQEELEIAKERLTSKGMVLYKEEAGDRPRLQLGGSQRFKPGYRVAKIDPFTPAAFVNSEEEAENDDLPDISDNKIPMEHNLKRQSDSQISLENCLKKVQIAVLTLYKDVEDHDPNQIGFFEETEDGKVKEQEPLNDGTWITGERHGELHALDNPGPG
jgi:DNA modification methylase